jgi:hypothetical protein
MREEEAILREGVLLGETQSAMEAGRGHSERRKYDGNI